MAGAASRDLRILKDSTPIAGVNSKSIAVADEPIDVTTDEDSGFRTLLEASGTKTMDISFSGVTKDQVMEELIMTGGSKLLTDITVEFPTFGAQTTGATISGNFFFNGMTINGGGSDGAIEFDGTLQSSGEWTYTPGS